MSGEKSNITVVQLAPTEKNGKVVQVYRVKQVVNRTEPKIGEVLTEFEVKSLISPRCKVTIVER